MHIKLIIEQGKLILTVNILLLTANEVPWGFFVNLKGQGSLLYVRSLHASPSYADSSSRPLK